MKKPLAAVATTFATSIAAATLLAACGGGSSSPDTGTGTVIAPLSVYAGSWQAPCDDHELDSVTLSAKANGTLEVITKAEYFVASNCSGTPLATQTTSANASISFTGSADSPVKFTTGGATTTVKLDKVNVAIPSYKTLITGSGVQYLVELGQAKWCFNLGASSRSCILDTGTEPASATSGGMYINGNTLYLLSLANGTWVPDEIYTRK